MSSYFPSFNYMGLNSFKDKNLIVVHFESGDEGEMDTFLGMDQIYTENPYGTKRITYGAKYNNVAVIRISVMKADGQDFTTSEVRDFLKWTTGVQQNSYLDLVDNEVVKVSFLGHVTAVYQQKLDARTIGFVIEHTSVSPWAYSSPQTVSCSFGQELIIDTNGVLSKQNNQPLSVDTNGVLTNGTDKLFSFTNDGTTYLDNSVKLNIHNSSDDLYSYVNLDTTFANTNSDHLIIKNQTLYEESDGQDGLTEIVGMAGGEVIKLYAGQFITSDATEKIFGDRFNFIWPKLMPGDNIVSISGTGSGNVEFTYRYPIKIGDCAIDIYVYNNSLCGECLDVYRSVSWDDIIDLPSTISGYGITDAYTITEVDNKIGNIDININQDELTRMLQETLG